jgi:hypothetical protein
MFRRRRVVFALVGVSLLVAGCGPIEDLEDDLSTITIPDVTIPDVTLPDVTLPDVTLPDVTLPDITLPDVTLPDVSLPELTTTTTVPDPVVTTAPAPSSTTSVVAVTTTSPPTTTSAPTTTTTTTQPSSTQPPTATTVPPTTTTAVEATTTEPPGTSTVVEASPSTTLPDDTEEEGSALWWALAAVVGAVVAAWALDRSRKEAAALAASQAEWDDRIRGAYIRGRWVLDQFDERLPDERSIEADPRGLRAGVETVVEDLYRLEADAVNVDTRAMIRELSDAIRGLDRATDVAAGLLTGGADQSSVEVARGRLVAVLERVAATIQPDTSPPV